LSVVKNDAAWSPVPRARSSLTPNEIPARAEPASVAAAQTKTIKPKSLFIVLLVASRPGP
jgi:hypothetical protein